MRKAHIFYNLNLPKSHPSAFTNTLICHTSIICYLIRICVYLECLRETLETFETRKSRTCGKGSESTGMYPSMQCVQNTHSNMDDLESLTCQMCMSLYYRKTSCCEVAGLTTKPSCCCKHYSVEINDSICFMKLFNYCWISRTAVFMMEHRSG